MNELALFAGAGGGILGGKLLGWRTVCAVEWEPYAAGVLAARQNDKVLEPFPIWDDVQTFDGTPWRGIVDVVSGGFPCQDISSAGKGAGIDGDRSSMWYQMARIIGEVRPRFVFVENSPLLVERGLAVVLGDLAKLGFDAAWTCVSAGNTGAPHQRDRIWIVGHAAGERWPKNYIGVWQQLTEWEKPPRTWNGRRVDKPGIVGVVDGVAAGVERLKATGNGQVPRVAAAAFAILAEQLMTANAKSTPKTSNIPAPVQ